MQNEIRISTPKISSFVMTAISFATNGYVYSYFGVVPVLDVDGTVFSSFPQKRDENSDKLAYLGVRTRRHKMF